jgi:hypothetical protein
VHGGRSIVDDDLVAFAFHPALGHGLRRPQARSRRSTGGRASMLSMPLTAGDRDRS